VVTTFEVRGQDPGSPIAPSWRRCRGLAGADHACSGSRSWRTLGQKLGAKMRPWLARPLVARGRSKVISMAVHASSADGPRNGARRVCVELNPGSADRTRRIPVAVLVCVYALVADRARRSAVAVTISAHVLAADPACRVAISISVSAYDAAAVSAGRITRSIRAKAALGTQRENGYRERQGCKNEAPHETPP
jgi:hypothetical protein